MSFIPSLVLYNPLEALVLILFCDIFTKRKFKVSDIIHCYILGAINLLFQYVSMFMSDNLMILIYDFISLFIMVLILFVYYNLILRRTIKLMYCGLAILFLIVSMIIVPSIFSFIFGDVYNYMGFNNIYYEFVVNILNKLLQFFMILLLNLGVNKIERIKKNTKRNSKQFC